MEGIEGGVAVIRRMLPSSDEASSPGGRPQQPSAEEFARQVQDRWRVGKQGCENGFLLFASKEDRQFALSVVRASLRREPDRPFRAATACCRLAPPLPASPAS